AGRQDGEEAENFFALGGIAKIEAHSHAETGMGGENLTANAQLGVGGADQNFNGGLAGERRRHFHVATIFADIGQGAAVGNGGTGAVNFGSQFAGQAVLGAAVASVGNELGIFQFQLNLGSVGRSRGVRAGRKRVGR